MEMNHEMHCVWLAGHGAEQRGRASRGPSQPALVSVVSEVSDLETCSFPRVCALSYWLVSEVSEIRTAYFDRQVSGSLTSLTSLTTLTSPPACGLDDALARLEAWGLVRGSCQGRCIIEG
jgi:hypothetical protein